MFVLEVFRPDINFQVTMNVAKRISVDMAVIFIMTLTSVFIAGSTKKEPNGNLRTVAEAGRIEEPLLRERINSGIYKWSLEKSQYWRSCFIYLIFMFSNESVSTYYCSSNLQMLSLDS